ncbi:MAG: hypothetical protein KJO07_02840 [Deltaproteobacteria bacterium]|nr:hypothetical protein [Deltaproteobacteria bacterium]
MARDRKSKNKGKPRGRAKERPPGSKPSASKDEPREPVRPQDRRPLIYGALDLLFAVAYGLTFALVVPNRFAGYSLILWALVVAIGAAGIGTLSRRPQGWLLACVGCSLQLGLTLILLVLLAISSAFLAGVYGALGQGAAVLALVFAALVVQLVGLLPAFQLKYLMTRAGRRSFGRS